MKLVYLGKMAASHGDVKLIEAFAKPDSDLFSVIRHREFLFFNGLKVCPYSIGSIVEFEDRPDGKLGVDFGTTALCVGRIPDGDVIASAELLSRADRRHADLERKARNSLSFMDQKIEGMRSIVRRLPKASRKAAVAYIIQALMEEA